MDEEKQTPETSNDSEAAGAAGAQGETAQANQGAPAQTQGAEKKIAAGVLGIALARSASTNSSSVTPRKA